jgi:hypothetical protein
MSSLFVNAQKFTAKVSKSRLGVNERLRIQYSIDKQGADDFRPPNFTNFKIVAGPMQSTNFQYINGKQTFEKSFTYTIQPKNKGKFTIPPATATFNGKTIYSNKVVINVTKAIDKPKDANDPDLVAKENIFLVAEISNYNPYVGESISVVYKLFMDTNNAAVNNEQETKSPEYSGFWKQNIQIKNLTERKGTYNEREMSYYILRKDVLIPQQSGKLKISPLEVDISAIVASGKPRRDFFGRVVRGQKRVHLTLSTGRRTLNVKTLPIENKPANFDGAVGEYNFIVRNSKSLLKANESAQIQVKVTGKGNLKLINLPKIETPKGLEQYEPEHKDGIRTNLSGLSGYVQDTYTIVPQYKGKYKIPALSFSYFNPKTSEYNTITSNPIIIDVPEGKLPEESDDLVVKNKNNSVVTDNDIRAIHTKTKLSEITKKEDFFKSDLFYLLLLLPMLSIPLGIFLGNKKRERDGDIAGNKRRKADRLAKKYLSAAKKQLGNKEPFYIALEKALHNYLKAKLQVETSEISKEKISAILSDKKVDGQTISKFIKVLNDCDFARYTPTSNLQMEQEYQNAAEIITELDKQI